MAAVLSAYVKPRSVSTPAKLLINNEWIESEAGKRFSTFDPATGEEIARIAEADTADVDRAVIAARKALEHGPWRTMSASERGRLLTRLAELLEIHAEELAQLEALDNGMPL